LYGLKFDISSLPELLNGFLMCQIICNVSPIPGLKVGGGGGTFSGNLQATNRMLIKKIKRLLMSVIIKNLAITFCQTTDQFGLASN
jgi:hypothetical protein